MKTLTKQQYNEVLNVVENVADEMCTTIELAKDIYVVSKELTVDMLDHNGEDMMVEATVWFGWDNGFEQIEVTEINIDRVFNDEEDLMVA